MDYLNNNIKNKFIKLIISAVKNKCDSSISVSDDEIKFIIRLSTFHSLENVIYVGLKLNGLIIPLEFENLNKVLFYKAVTQDCELDSICNELSKNKLWHMPLKGSVLRKEYPKGEMRSMADLDILVEKNKLKEVRSIIKGLGYTVGHLGGNHDTYFKKPYMNIEMHRNMVDMQYHMYDYYSDIWTRINKDKGYTCYLDDNDFYIYNIIHAGKHFSHGGTGLRCLVDIYYYTNNSNHKLNYDYIYSELDKTDFKVFGIKIKELSDTLFDEKELDNDLMMLLEFICDCGTYGTIQNSSTIGIINENTEDLEDGKKDYFWKRLFPPYKVMKKRNPILLKAPILLPWFWFTRLVKGLFHYNNSKNQMDIINKISENEIERIKRIQDITKVRR